MSSHLSILRLFVLLPLMLGMVGCSPYDFATLVTDIAVLGPVAAPPGYEKKLLENGEISSAVASESTIVIYAWHPEKKMSEKIIMRFEEELSSERLANMREVEVQQTSSVPRLGTFVEDQRTFFYLINPEDRSSLARLAQQLETYTLEDGDFSEASESALATAKKHLLGR